MSLYLNVLNRPDLRKRFQVTKAIYDSLHSGVWSPPDPALQAFLDEVTARYPQLDAWPDDVLDDCPWDEPFEHADGILQFAIAEVWWDEIRPWLLELAQRHGLTAFDDADERVYLPRPRPGA